MDDLIKALQIFKKYSDTRWPTHCAHDILYIMDVEPDEVSKEDVEELAVLGFFIDDEGPRFASHRFGSA